MRISPNRTQGEAYYEILDEFVTAVMNRWPRAILQFEDFSMDHALPLLERYRNHHLVFNDDIQVGRCSVWIVHVMFCNLLYGVCIRIPLLKQNHLLLFIDDL